MAFKRFRQKADDIHEADAELVSRLRREELESKKADPEFLNLILSYNSREYSKRSRRILPYADHSAIRKRDLQAQADHLKRQNRQM